MSRTLPRDAERKRSQRGSDRRGSVARSASDAKPEEIDVVPDNDFVGSKFQSSPDDRVEGIFVPAWAVRVGKTKAQVLVLSQLAYWFAAYKRKGELRKTRARLNKGGYIWVYKTYSQLAKECHLKTKDMARAAVRALVQAGVLLLDDDDPEPGARWFRLDPDRIADLLDPPKPKKRTGKKHRH